MKLTRIVKIRVNLSGVNFCERLIKWSVNFRDLNFRHF